jgi:hypothetical protein
MLPKLFGVAFARDPDHEAELPPGPGLDSDDGVVDNNRPSNSRLRWNGAVDSIFLNHVAPPRPVL